MKSNANTEKVNGQATEPRKPPERRPRPAQAGIADPDLRAREVGRQDGLLGVRDNATRYPAGKWGHGDYELGHAEGQRGQFDGQREQFEAERVRKIKALWLRRLRWLRWLARPPAESRPET